MQRMLMTVLAGACLYAPAPAAAQVADQSAQLLAQRIGAEPAHATVRFEFAARAGVCGVGNTILVRAVRDGRPVTLVRHGSWTQSTHDPEFTDCEVGPVQVELTRTDGTIMDVTMRVGRAAGDAMVDLGRVAPEAAVEFLLDPAVLQSAAERQARRLIIAATLADAESWPALLRVAQHRELSGGTRSSAIHFLGEAAAERVVAGLNTLVRDDSDEMQVRKAAVFALSRTGGEEAVDALIDIARRHSEPAIRRDAMFWLGRSGDLRAVAFFAEVLGGR